MKINYSRDDHTIVTRLEEYSYYPYLSIYYPIEVSVSDAREKNNLCKMSRTFKIYSIRSHNDKPFVTGSTLFVSLKSGTVNRS